MINRKTKLLLAGLIVLIAAFYISPSTAFVALLLGLLFIPPALMIGAAVAEGTSIISKGAFEKEKEVTVISA
ncbi:Uncharacterised protein [uncultured archaeon]|nr:Uncharacterised protein [uncultured archaeon]